MKLVALTGLPRSGKDTAATWFTRHGYVRLRFADPLKEAAAILLNRPLWQMHGEDGFDREAMLPEWGFSTRWFLQRFGTECLREQIRPDFWLQRMRASIADVHPAPVVITDCRFPNEAVMVREFGGIVISVWRPGIAGSAHVSDKELEADYSLVNHGSIADLYENVAGLMGRIHADTSRRPASR